MKLEQIKELETKIQQKQHKMMELWCSVTYPGVSYEMKVQATKDNNKHSDDICKIIDLEHEIKRLLDEQIKILKELNEAIKVLEPIEAKIIQLRYVKFKTWDDIADEIGKSRRWTHELHKKALKKLQML